MNILSLTKASFQRLGEPIPPISWELNENEDWIVLGKNGSGKSTFLECLSGKFTLTQGEMWIDGEKTTRSTKVQLVSFHHSNTLFKRETHYYQQRFHSTEMDSEITVAEYLQKLNLPYENDPLIAKLGINKLLHLELIKLSNGQNRRVHLIKSLLQRSKVMLLDNVYLGLDKKTRSELNTILQDYKEEHQTSFVITTNEYELIPPFITHQVEFDTMSIVYSGKIKPSIKKTFNIELNTITKYFDVQKKEYKNKIAIEFIHTSIHYGGKLALNNINWKINQGEKWSLIGENGSGKSTIFSLIYADHPQAYANTIILFDWLRGTGESIWDIKSNIGFTSPELHLYFDYSLSVVETITTGFFDSFVPYKISSQDEEFVFSLIDFFSLSPKKNFPLQKLSTGETRVVLFLRALIKSPALLLMDEPFQMFDEINREKAKAILTHCLSPKQSMIFITHFDYEIPPCVTHSFYLQNGRGIHDN